ncbi:MAG: GNAT family acetyltransferase [Podoviridae sp. ctrTa16]|nr:MAG: GNAT family acetyltransferase [Podoviridae sp. ctrTa16]
MLHVRKISEEDYDSILTGWWKDWGWTPPQKDFLPDNGTGGIIVYDEDRPVCAGFMYVTNSSVTWIDWIVSDKNYRDKPNRKESLRLLIDTLTNTAMKAGSKYLYALIKNKNLIELYESFGYMKGDEYTGEMIKTL